MYYRNTIYVILFGFSTSRNKNVHQTINIHIIFDVDIEIDVFLDYRRMYGAVQAARQWSKKLTEVLTGKLGLTQSRAYPCLFYLKRFNELVLIVGTHVDDQHVAGCQQDVEDFKTQLSKYFTIKALGPVWKHLRVYYEMGKDQVGK